MATKWADYGISKVRYNTEKTHIIKVRLHEDKGDKLGQEQEWTRSQVVSAIEQSKSFVTVLQANGRKWEKGQDVHIITVNNVKYIRTDQNRTSSDNLENLPEF